MPIKKTNNENFYPKKSELGHFSNPESEKWGETFKNFFHHLPIRKKFSLAEYSPVHNAKVAVNCQQMKHNVANTLIGSATETLPK